MAVCGFFQGLGYHLYPYPIQFKICPPTKKKKTTKQNEKQGRYFHSFMLKMSYNEFPTRAIAEANAPGQYRGWIQTIHLFNHCLSGFLLMRTCTVTLQLKKHAGVVLKQNSGKYLTHKKTHPKTIIKQTKNLSILF